MSDKQPGMVPHPSAPIWLGNRAWSAEGEPDSGFVVWDTDDDLQPFKITHNRDFMMNDGEVEQDYNFIDYWFGNPTDPVTARFYLDNPQEVSVISSDRNTKAASLVEAIAAIPADVLLYLFKRFSSVLVLTDKGYEQVEPS